MKRKTIIVAVLALGLVAGLPFVGAQVRWDRDQDHAPFRTYDPFIKRSPSFQFVFFDPLDCGACEERTAQNLDDEDRQALRTLCEARRDEPASCRELRSVGKR